MSEQKCQGRDDGNDGERFNCTKMLQKVEVNDTNIKHMT